jgi:hypothetical protein
MELALGGKWVGSLRALCALEGVRNVVRSFTPDKAA